MQLFSYVRAGTRRTFRAGLLGSAALVVVAGVALPISFDGPLDGSSDLLVQKAAQAQGNSGGGGGNGGGGGGGNSGGGGGNSGGGGASGSSTSAA
ncbi:MAG: hypothetical protein IID55_10665, partial [Proteobacteria bacterium]|nr:hypothetical protein [Pseudomonadota bacterium]